MGKLIGIDLGTTNTAAAFWDHDQPRMIPNDRGSYITPSVVAFGGDGSVLVGEAARNQALVNAEGTVEAVKRSMGTHQIFAGGGREFSPEEISSLLLKKMKQDAETHLAAEVTQAVITVPAYFNENQRRATQEAGQLAGFQVRRILNEPTAAALVYAGRREEEEILLVYDLGGGTFDVSLLHRQGNSYRVLATRGDNHLGGIDFDALLTDQVADRFEKEAYPGVREDPIIMQQLREQVERVKIELSSRHEASVVLPFFRNRGKPEHFIHPVTRKDFEEMIRPRIRKTAELVQGALTDAGLEAEAVGSLILSGGSSRIPLVEDVLRRQFGWEALKQVNPDETVALGAAIQSALLDQDEIALQDVTPFSLGIEVVGGECVPVIERNSPLPIRGKRLFTTVEDNQSSVEVHALQGESSRAEGNLSLGRFLLSGIREGKRGEPRIEVTFMIDQDGILHVEAEDRDTRAKQKVTFTSDASAGAEGTADQLESRIHSLERRLHMLLFQKKESLGEDFTRQIEEEVKEAVDGLNGYPAEEMKERRLWLESLIGEVHARLQVQETEVT